MGNFIDRVMARIYGRYPSLLKRFARGDTILTFHDTYFVKPVVPKGELRVALVTTGGVHLKDQLPFDMSDRDGDPMYREIPKDADFSDLTVTHDYYDNRDARKDPGVVFPLDALRDMESDGEIGEVSGRHFSFMGHIQGKHLETLISRTAPEVASELRKDGVGAVLFAPA